MATDTLKSGSGNNLLLSNDDASAKIEVKEDGKNEITGNTGIGTTPSFAVLNSGALELEATGDQFPGLRIERSSGSSYTNKAFELLITNEGALNFYDASSTSARLLIESTGAIYSTDWTDFTPSQSGMSSASLYFASYMRLGNLIFVQVYIYGTGNATTWTATLNNGYDNDSTANAYAPITIAYAVNDGSNVSHLVNGWISPGSQTVTFQLNGASGGWTASGSRHMNFSAVYRANSI